MTMKPHSMDDYRQNSMYRYIAELIRVVDGDTIDVRVDLGFQITQVIRVRLKGINTPELRGKEKAAGMLAKDVVCVELEAAKVIGT